LSEPNNAPSDVQSTGDDTDVKKTISQPPINLLFNPSSLARKDVWSIDLASLLTLFLQILNSSGNKDLRICGIAALTSSMIYRLKVESIFALEKIAMQRQALADQQSTSFPELKAIEVPFRLEPTYPVSVEELLVVLENMISELANPRPRKKQIDLEPVQTFDFGQYLVKFEQIIKGYEDMISDIINADGPTMFKALIANMEPVEVARYFIAMLYLAMKGKVIIEQNEGSDDIRILPAQSC
jgi:segregation and condensation protein A